ncbi:MAG: SRPBCC family protein [Chloroflexota bacterium]|nr:SRPBCC family protein [Chloroflexota bacterium]
MATTRITAEPGLPFIDLEREFDAPRDLIFRAHTEPDLLVQWLGPRRLTMTIDRMEIREGGKWRYVHREPDGTEHGFHGVFHGTPSNDGIVQTFEYEGTPGHVSLESLTLEERDGRTVVRIHSVYQSVEARDVMIESGMEQGVNEGYERLDELTGRLVPVG